jgi:hypothetical protein
MPAQQTCAASASAWALAGLVVCAIAFIAVAVVTRRAAAQIDTQIAELEKQR